MATQGCIRITTTAPTTASSNREFIILVNTNQFCVSSTFGIKGGSTTRYHPFGSYRGTTPSQTVTDRNYTGHAHNNDLGLVYMNARYYVVYINQHPHHHQAQGGQSFCWYGKFCRTRCYLVQANQRFALHSLSTRFLRSFRPPDSQPA
jgi:hypothetical protein